MSDAPDRAGQPADGGAGRRKRRMTARWRYTNRLNAQASTGPRTAAGKRAVARNSRRHGLSLPVLADPSLAPEVEILAREIAQSVTGRRLEGEPHILACAVAETMIDLRRVRAAKHPVVVTLHADPANCAKPLREIERLDRYEKRAWLRRKRAIRMFGEAVIRQNKAMEGKAKDSNEAVPSPKAPSRSAE